MIPAGTAEEFTAAAKRVMLEADSGAGRQTAPQPGILPAAEGE